MQTEINKDPEKRSDLFAGLEPVRTAIGIGSTILLLIMAMLLVMILKLPAVSVAFLSGPCMLILFVTFYRSEGCYIEDIISENLHRYTIDFESDDMEELAELLEEAEGENKNETV